MLLHFNGNFFATKFSWPEILIHQVRPDFLRVDNLSFNLILPYQNTATGMVCRIASVNQNALK